MYDKRQNHHWQIRCLELSTRLPDIDQATHHWPHIYIYAKLNNAFHQIAIW